MNLGLRAAHAIDRVNSRIGRAASWLAALMVLIGAYNAIVRYLGRHLGAGLSSNAYIELQWYLFSALFLLGAAFTLGENRHVRVDVIYGRLSTRVRAGIDLAGSVLFLIPFSIFGVVLSWPSVRNSWSVLEGSPDPGGLPRYPIKTLLLVAFVLLLLQGVSQAIKSMAVLSGSAGEPDDARTVGGAGL